MNCSKCCVFAFKENLCEDDFCKKYAQEGSADDFTNMLMARQWTPCSERLPEKNGWYLLQFGKHGMFVGAYFADRKVFGEWHENIGIDEVNREFEEYHPVAWMPLPEPWKGE